MVGHRLLHRQFPFPLCFNDFEGIVGAELSILDVVDGFVRSKPSSERPSEP
jgi:hypothetical protein